MKHYCEEYTKELPKFSKEICIALDKIIHKTYPEIQEGKKWESISYWIDKGLICGFFANKDFVTLMFYDGALLKDTKKILSTTDNIRSRSIRFTSIQEVSNIADVLNKYIVESINNNKNGKKIVVGKRTIETPQELRTILAKEKLLEKFEAMSYSTKKDYIEWITKAKREETKKERLQKALKQISLGKGLYDKYK
jgi:uncharacterized protein YdeI (YjbR/CyaY-like superfamily)